jgi:hypothetical protein
MQVWITDYNIVLLHTLGLSARSSFKITCFPWGFTGFELLWFDWSEQGAHVYSTNQWLVRQKTTGEDLHSVRTCSSLLVQIIHAAACKVASLVSRSSIGLRIWLDPHMWFCVAFSRLIAVSWFMTIYRPPLIGLPAHDHGAVQVQTKTKQYQLVVGALLFWPTQSQLMRSG